MESLKVNGKTVAGKNQAITDTGSSELFLPHSVAQNIAQEAGARLAGGAYLIKCSAKFTVTLVVNGVNVDINQDQLVIPVPRTGQCRLAVAGGDNMYLFGDPLIR